MNSLIGRLSGTQLKALYSRAEELGAPVPRLWAAYHNEAGNGPKKVAKLSRDVLKRMLSSCWLGSACESFNISLADTYKLFQGCPNRPRWFKVEPSASARHAFFSKELSSWTRPKLQAGSVLLLIPEEDTEKTEWYAQVKDGREEKSFIPASYVKTQLLTLADDTIDRPDAKR